MKLCGQKYILYFLFTLLGYIPLASQNESNIWYFSDWLGLDFNRSPPTVLQNGNIFGIDKHPAVLSDNVGNLLLYTNGRSIWGKDHQTLVNGHNVFSDILVIKSIPVIIPVPCKNSEYLVVLFDGNQSFDEMQLKYAHVDLSVSPGIVSNKSTINFAEIVKPTTALIRHSNNIDFWLLLPDADELKVHSFLINENGINENAVVSTIGSASASCYDRIRVSLNGFNVALLNHNGVLTVADFNPGTGTVSSPINLPVLVDDDPTSGINSVSFSPDASLLYVSTNSVREAWQHLDQYDLTSRNFRTVLSSQIRIDSITIRSKFVYNNLSIGPDMKIYVAADNADHLGLIEFPNQRGTACSYKREGIFLEGERSGDQTFLPVLFPFRKHHNFTSEGNCPYRPISFHPRFINEFDSVVWSFDDPLSGTLNSSRDTSPTHIFRKAGIYNVCMCVYNCGESVDSVIREVEILSPVYETLPDDTVVCKGTPVLLDLSASQGIAFAWNDSNTGSIYQANNPGYYGVEITAAGLCSLVYDDITIHWFDPDQLPDLSGTSYCEGDTIRIVLDTISGIYGIVDDLGQMAEDISIFLPGTYNYQLSTVCGKLPWEFTPNYKQEPNINIDPVIYWCGNQPVFDFCSEGMSDITWDHREVPCAFAVDSLGKHTLRYSSECRDYEHDLVVEICNEPPRIFIPNLFSPNGDGVNDLFEIHYLEDVIPVSLSIFNRWGNLITTSKTKWDGNMKNKQSPSGVYIYHFRYRDLYGNEKVVSGDVLVVR